MQYRLSFPVSGNNDAGHLFRAGFFFDEHITSQRVETILKGQGICKKQRSGTEM